ncbi:MAG: amino acid ABC transporter substrate-binding protein, partial [Bdellovibrio sp.]
MRSIYFLLALCLPGLCFAHRKELKVATDPTSWPYAYYKNHKLVGFDVDLAKALCDKLDVDCVNEKTTWDAVTAQLDSGKADAVFSIPINDEHLDHML